MSLDLAKRVVDYIVQIHNGFNDNEVVFDFIGGEPFLEIELISKICDYIVKKESEFRDKTIRFRITTNGINYGSKAVQNYINRYKKYIDLSISIDGTPIKHDLNRVYPNGKGSYDDVVENIGIWTRQFDTTLTKMVVSHEDLPFVFDSVKHLIALGVKKIDINYVVENVWESGDGKIFERQLIQIIDYLFKYDLYKKNIISFLEHNLGGSIKDQFEQEPCGKNMLVVDSDGTFYVCMRFSNYSLHSKKPRDIGNIKEGINKNKLRPYLTLEPQAYYPSVCMNCEIGGGCKSCPAENYDSSETGTIFHRQIASCELHKAMVRAKNYYIHKLNMTL